jgi:hypothetical protein
MREPNRKQRRSASSMNRRNRADRTRLWQTLFRREKRTPGLTKNIPDICGELWRLRRGMQVGQRAGCDRARSGGYWPLAAGVAPAGMSNAQRSTSNVQLQKREQAEVREETALVSFIGALDVGRWTLDVCLPASASPRTTPQTSAAPRSGAWSGCNSEASSPSKYRRRSTAHRRVAPAAR